MCLAVIACDAHPRYAVVIAANRDEFHARPTLPAAWWDDATGVRILAGRDLEHGGTWLGVAPDGRFAFVTNVRDCARHDPLAPSRGALVPALLRDARPLVSAMRAIVADTRAYNGFNLVGGEGAIVTFASNRSTGDTLLRRGIHGVSNAGLDTPWPKLVRAKAGLAAWAAKGDGDLASLWPVLADRTPARDDELPDTGIGRPRERLLSSPFIVSAAYGTRSSTLVTLGREGEARFIERSFDATGAQTGEVAFRFALDQSASRITQCAMPASSNPSPVAANPCRS